MEEKELLERCRRIARRVLADRGWELVQDEAAFVEEVLAEVRARRETSRRSLDKVIADATINRYCHLWYAACGADGTLSQRQAFRELHRYLYPIALYRAKHDKYIAEESAQEALIKVWQHLDQVVDPGSFARWAGTIVSNRVTAKFREQARKTEKVENGEVTWQTKEIAEADTSTPLSTSLQVREGAGTQTRGIGDRPDLSAGQGSKMTDEMQARIEAAIQHCLSNEQQREVIIGLFLDEASGKEVADTLHTTPGYVYVLKHRALEYLRKCEEFLEVLEVLL